jgi:hypothetical protein
MIEASGYILRVQESRREILLEEVGLSRFDNKEIPAGEPVPRFEHSRSAPMVVFACFQDNAITHIADGKKGLGAGRGLVVLNMRNLEALERPIRFTELRRRSPSRIRVHIDRVLSSGGKLSPSSLSFLVDTLIEIQPSIAIRLGRFSERRASLISDIPRRSRINLALQKETLTSALAITGFGTEDILSWSPQVGETTSFLDGLTQAYVREDAAVISDLGNIPGFSAIKGYQFAARRFHSDAKPGIRLTVIMANHLPLEEQTGADLIYHNETFNSFVLVQYKSMSDGPNGPEFRWQENDQLAIEIARMENITSGFGALPDDLSTGGFRLHNNPFFLKLCRRILFNPDDKGLFPGMYLPLGLWKCLSSSPATLGPRGGRVLRYDNVDRKLTNTEFVSLVSNAWVGTTAPQSSVLEKVIKEVIRQGRTVTLAVRSDISERKDSGS